MEEDEIGPLFALPPEEFVAARDALAARLRKEGNRDGAGHVRQLRRPTLPAWAVDQLPRTHVGDIDLLLKAGSRLRQAQQQALSGRGGADLREASARRRELIDHLTDLAARILVDGGRDPQPHRAAIAATLEAATVNADAAEALRSGTLSKELTPSSDFGALAPSVTPPPEEPSEDHEAVEPDDRAARRTELREEFERAQDQANQAVQHAREAEHEAEDARREAEAATEEVEQLEKQLREGRRRAETAARRQRNAIATSGEARQNAERRAAEVEKSQQRLDRDDAR